MRKKRMLTEEHKMKISKLRKGKFISNSYTAIHYWIREYGPKKDECEICGNRNIYLEWANKNHDYKRDLNDWMFICRSCHKKYDLKKGFIDPTWKKGMSAPNQETVFKKGHTPWNKGKKKHGIKT